MFQAQAFGGLGELKLTGNEGCHTSVCPQFFRYSSTISICCFHSVNVGMAHFLRGPYLLHAR